MTTTNFTNSQMPNASTTEKGAIIIATNSDVSTGTNETKAVNSKNLKDNYSSGLVNGTSANYTGLTQQVGTLTIPLGRNNVKTVQFAMHCYGWKNYNNGNERLGRGTYIGTYKLLSSGINVALNYVEEIATSFGGTSIPAQTLNINYTPVTVPLTIRTTTLTAKEGSVGFSVTGVYVSGSDLKIDYTLEINAAGSSGVGYIGVGPITILN